MAVIKQLRVYFRYIHIFRFVVQWFESSSKIHYLHSFFCKSLYGSIVAMRSSDFSNCVFLFNNWSFVCVKELVINHESVNTIEFKDWKRKYGKFIRKSIDSIQCELRWYMKTQNKETNRNKTAKRCSTFGLDILCTMLWWPSFDMMTLNRASIE